MPVLAELGQAPCRQYDVALLDLDGVVYIGTQPAPGAAPALATARQRGMRLAFVTNNAARPPSAVAELLESVGVPATAAEVITSAQTAAHYLSRHLPAGSRVLVIGAQGLHDAITERGLTPVSSADDDPAAVVQGFSPSMDWALLAEACVAVRRQVPWVATNLDVTVPSPRGPVLGNGSLVAAVRTATGVDPVATGKPDPTMHRETVERSGAQRPLVVGDRLDTDIEGANRAGCDSLLVLTGVTDVATLVTAPAAQRPTLLAADLAGLVHPHHGVQREGEVARCGEARARRQGSRILVRAGTEHPAGAIDALDVVRAACACAWAGADNGSTPGAGWTVEGEDAAARAVLADVGL